MLLLASFVMRLGKNWRLIIVLLTSPKHVNVCVNWIEVYVQTLSLSIILYWIPLNINGFYFLLKTRGTFLDWLSSWHNLLILFFWLDHEKVSVLILAKHCIKGSYCHYWLFILELERFHTLTDFWTINSDNLVSWMDWMILFVSNLDYSILSYAIIHLSELLIIINPALLLAIHISAFCVVLKVILLIVVSALWECCTIVVVLWHMLH